MSGDQPARQPLTPQQAAAWATYLDDTTDARERYAKAVDDAHDESEQAREQARHTQLAADRDAWERYQAACCGAWHEYETDTQAARQRRDDHLANPYPAMTP